MRWLRLLALAGLAAYAAAATTPRSPFADLADRARALDPEFAANALLRIADAPAVADVAWKREILEDAFRLAAGAQEPFARRNWTGNPVSLFDKAYAQGLDACTLQCKAVHAMLAIDYKKARELFAEIPPPRVPPLTCEDALAYDVSIFYVTAEEVAARAFNAKEVMDEEPFHLLERYAAAMDSPAEVAPVARMIVGTSLKPALFEALVNSFAGALAQLSGDDRSFSATVRQGADTAVADLLAECAHRRINGQPLSEAWQAYMTRQLGGARCPDGAAHVPGLCVSGECQQVASQFRGLMMGPNGYALTPRQKATGEWGGRLRQYLAALADWKGDDDPEECFRFKSRVYGDLWNTAPHGPLQDLLLGTLLGWLQQSDYRSAHRVEWFYPVNTLIVHAFADPAANAATVRQLRRSADPVVSLYAELELLLPRPGDQTIWLM